MEYNKIKVPFGAGADSLMSGSTKMDKFWRPNQKNHLELMLQMTLCVLNTTEMPVGCLIIIEILRKSTKG